MHGCKAIDGIPAIEAEDTGTYCILIINYSGRANQ